VPRLPTEQRHTILPAPVVEEPNYLPAVVDSEGAVTAPLLPALPQGSGLQEDIVTAELLARSGFFPSVKTTAEAFAKMRLGRELGIGPVTAVKELYVVSGRIGMSAAIMAALLLRSPKYDYRVIRLDNQAAVIHFFRNGELIGESSFTIQDARQAGLENKDNWRKYPRNMLWARALANGVRWFCSDTVVGSAYIPDELGLDVVEGIVGE